MSKKKIPSKSLVKIPPQCFPSRVSMERDAPSPEPIVYSFIYTCWSPKKEPSLEMRRKHTVTVLGAPHRLKVYVQWGVVWSPRGSLTTLLSLPQRHATFSTIPSTLAWVDKSPISQRVVATLNRVYSSHLLPPPT